MRIACSICVLFALSFPRTVSAEEWGGDEDVTKLAKKVKKNYRTIRSLGKRATNLEYEDVVLDDKVGKLSEDLVGTVVEFDAQVTSLKEDITDLDGKLDTTTDNLNGTVVEVEGKVIELNGTVINLDGNVNSLKEKLDGTVVKVTGLDEEITDLSSHLEDEVEKLKLLIDAQDTSLKEDITDLDGKLEDEVEKLKLLIEELMKLSNIFGGYEYLFSATKQTWADHETAALNWGGHLASVHSLSEHNFIVQRAKQALYLGGRRISLDATDGSDKAWKWSDGTNWDYTVWRSNEPNSAYEDSLIMSPNLWNDVRSSQSSYGVYKRPYP